MTAFLVGATGCLALLFVVIVPGRWLAERRCQIENARRSAEWRVACEEAERKGEFPPFPPLEIHIG